VRLGEWGLAGLGWTGPDRGRPCGGVAGLWTRPHRPGSQSLSTVPSPHFIFPCPSRLGRGQVGSIPLLPLSLYVTCPEFTLRKQPTLAVHTGARWAPRPSNPCQPAGGISISCYSKRSPSRLLLRLPRQGRVVESQLLQRRDDTSNTTGQRRSTADKLDMRKKRNKSRNIKAFEKSSRPSYTHRHRRAQKHRVWAGPFWCRKSVCPALSFLEGQHSAPPRTLKSLFPSDPCAF
jgi:hypothetical protein